MKNLYLVDNWTLSGEKIGSVAATVPGCVHTDLIKCGVIENIYWRDNNDKYQWIENENFTYTCKFDAEESEYATLVFEGLAGEGPLPCAGGAIPSMAALERLLSDEGLRTLARGAHPMWTN